jgi:hypothetical protein
LLYSFAEHVQLRKDGWYHKAIDRTTLWHLFNSSNGLTHQILAERVVETLTISVEAHIVAAEIDELLAASLIVQHDSLLYISEAERTRLESERAHAIKIEAACSIRLDRTVRSNGTAGLVSWESFVNELVVPITSELGSRTFELLRGFTPVRDTEAARKYIESFDAADQDSIRNTIADYLDPNDPDVRHHLLGYVTGYTLLAAGGLSSQQLADALRSTGIVDFDVIVDTNVAFSLLNLHRNPLNDATRALLQLRETITIGATLRFHMLSSTVAEAQRSLENARRIAPSSAAPGAFISAATNTGVLSGLVEGYLDARESQRHLSAESYFAPLIDGFEAIVAEFGITVIDDSELTSSQSVKRRAQNWLSHQPTDGRGKSRIQLEHDALAVEMVQKRRGGEAKTAVAARWWFVTLDLRLQNRERKDLAGAHRLPSTINPAELVQLLRLWVPRSEKMESALVGAIRLPFTFYAYDPELERTALRILDTLAGVEGIAGLSEDAALRVFQDVTLRSQLAAVERGSSAEFAVVKEAIKRIDLTQTSRAASAELKPHSLQPQGIPTRTSDARSPVLGKSKNDVIKERDRWKAKATKLQDELDTHRRVNSDVPQAVAVAGSVDRERNLRLLSELRAHRIAVGLRWGGFALGLITAIIATLWILFDQTAAATFAIVLTAASFAVAVWSILPKQRHTFEQRVAAVLERRLRLNAGFDPVPASAGSDPQKSH